MESGKQRLDCACVVGLGFGPLVFTLWASLGALGFFNVFLTSFGVPLGPHFTGSVVEPAPSYLSIRTKSLLLEPRFSASAPLRGLLRAAWWVVPRTAAGSTSPSASTRPRAVCTCFLVPWGLTPGLSATFGGLVMFFGHCG